MSPLASTNDEYNLRQIVNQEATCYYLSGREILRTTRVKIVSYVLYLDVINSCCLGKRLEAFSPKIHLVSWSAFREPRANRGSSCEMVVVFSCRGSCIIKLTLNKRLRGGVISSWAGVERTTVRVDRGGRVWVWTDYSFKEPKEPLSAPGSFQRTHAIGYRRRRRRRRRLVLSFCLHQWPCITPTTWLPPRLSAVFSSSGHPVAVACLANLYHLGHFLLCPVNRESLKRARASSSSTFEHLSFLQIYFHRCSYLISSSTL